MRLTTLLACTLAAAACDMPNDDDFQPRNEDLDTEETDPAPEPEPVPEPLPGEDVELGDAPAPEPPVVPDPVVPLHNNPPTEDGLPPVQVGDIVLAHMLPDRTAYGVNVCQEELWVHVLKANLTWADVLSPTYQDELTEYARSQREAWGYDENAFILAGWRFD